MPPKRRFLYVVEDNLDSCELIPKAFGDVEVVCAASGQECLELDPARARPGEGTHRVDACVRSDRRRRPAPHLPCVSRARGPRSAARPHDRGARELLQPPRGRLSAAQHVVALERLHLGVQTTPADETVRGDGSVHTCRRASRRPIPRLAVLSAPRPVIPLYRHRSEGKPVGATTKRITKWSLCRIQASGWKSEMRSSPQTFRMTNLRTARRKTRSIWMASTSEGSLPKRGHRPRLTQEVSTRYFLFSVLNT